MQDKKIFITNKTELNLKMTNFLDSNKMVYQQNDDHRS